MKHLIPSICLAFLAFISACGGGNDSESSNPYDGVPESLQELIGDVSMSWSYTQGGVEKHEELHFSYSRADVIGNQLVKKISSQYTLACSGTEFTMTGLPDYGCQLSPSNRTDGQFEYDKIELRRMWWTTLEGDFEGSIDTENDLSVPVSFIVTAPKS